MAVPSFVVNDTVNPPGTVPVKVTLKTKLVLPLLPSNSVTSLMDNEELSSLSITQTPVSLFIIAPETFESTTAKSSSSSRASSPKISTAIWVDVAPAAGITMV